MEKQFFTKVSTGLGTHWGESALGRKRKKPLYPRQRERSNKRQIFIDFSWPIPKYLVWTRLRASVYNPHQEGCTTSVSHWDREHVSGSETTLSGRKAYHHDSLFVVSSSRLSLNKTPPQEPHKSRDCAGTRSDTWLPPRP